MYHHGNIIAHFKTSHNSGFVDQRKRKRNHACVMCHVRYRLSYTRTKICCIINVETIDVKVLQLGKATRRLRINRIKKLIDLDYLSYLKNCSMYFWCIMFTYSSSHILSHVTL